MLFYVESSTAWSVLSVKNQGPELTTFSTNQVDNQHPETIFIDFRKSCCSYKYFITRKSFDST
jgi:hypothetical protein